MNPVRFTGTAAAALLVACATGGSGAWGTAAPGSEGSSSAYNQITFGSFAVIQSLAMSRQYVFAGAESGVAIYDRIFQRWLPPLTRTDWYGDDHITVMAGDPVEDALWYGVPGGVVVYRPATGQMQRSIVTGVPDLIAFDRATGGDAWVRSGGQWTRISRGGMATPGGAPAAGQLIIPGGLADVYRRFPTLRGQLPFLMGSTLPGRPMPEAQLISGALPPDRVTEAWLGTAGEGIWRVDPSFMQGTRLLFGPMEKGIGALAAGFGGIWAAGLGRSALHGGISFGSNDMQRWEWIEGTIAVPMRGTAARAIAVRGNRAWVGTENGLYRVRLDGARDIAMWSSLDGLPTDRVYAVAPRNDGVWVGTDRGLTWIWDTVQSRDKETRGVGETFIPNTTVRSLVAMGDTLWLGTDAGLMAFDTRTNQLLRPRQMIPELTHVVRSIAYSDSVMLVGTDDALVTFALRSDRPPERLSLNLAPLGQVTRVAIDPTTMFVAGISGLVSLQREGGVERQLTVGRDLPGPVLDVVAQEGWVWLATTEGLVRIRRSQDGRISR